MKLSNIITRLIDLFYIAPFRRIMPLQVFRYAACGGGNLVLGWVVYFVAYHYIVLERYFDLGVVVVSPHIAAFLITFPITLFTGYWLQSRISFQHSPLPSTTKATRYALSVVGSVILNYLGLKVCVEILGILPTLSQVIVSLTTVVYSYFMQKYYSFRGSSTPSRPTDQDL